MQRTAQVMDGRMASIYWCLTCEQFITKLPAEDRIDFELGFGEMWEFDGYREFAEARKH